MKDEEDKSSQNQNNCNVISLDDSRDRHEHNALSEDQANAPLNQLEEQYSFEDDEDTQSLLEALQCNEIIQDNPPDDGRDPVPPSESNDIPATAAEQSAVIENMVHAMAGDETDDPNQEDDEDDENEDDELEARLDIQGADSQSAPQAVELPNMEIAAEEGSAAANDVNRDHATLSSEAGNENTDKIPWNDLQGDYASDLDAEARRSRDAEELQALQRQQQPMVQTNVVGGLSHAFGSVLNAVFNTVGLALVSGAAAVKQGKEALGRRTEGATESKTAENGASMYFSPASKAVNDSFNSEVANDWKQNRIDSEFSSLQTDVDLHLGSVDKLKQTEWAQKLKSIEESGDPELMAKAPAILNLAKAQIDFKDADADMAYFQSHIQQRAERLSSMVKGSQLGSERLEHTMNTWQEEAKKRLDDLPATKETQGILERIQNVAHDAMAGLRSLFSKSAKIG